MRAHLHMAGAVPMPAARRQRRKEKEEEAAATPPPVPKPPPKAPVLVQLPLFGSELKEYTPPNHSRGERFPGRPRDALVQAVLIPDD